MHALISVHRRRHLARRRRPCYASACELRQCQTLHPPQCAPAMEHAFTNTSKLPQVPRDTSARRHSGATRLGTLDVALFDGSFTTRRGCLIFNFSSSFIYHRNFTTTRRVTCSPLVKSQRPSHSTSIAPNPAQVIPLGTPAASPAL